MIPHNCLNVVPKCHSETTKSYPHNVVSTTFLVLAPLLISDKNAIIPGDSVPHHPSHYRPAELEIRNDLHQ
jgi:hypothetical protein